MRVFPSFLDPVSITRCCQYFVLLVLFPGCQAAEVDHSDKSPESAFRPNILLILLDDAGYNDVPGFAERSLPMPNIEQLANEGLRFTRHYSDSTCRPSRLALMTGRYPSEVAGIPDFRGVSSEVETLPERLQDAGYSTHHIGKWHIGDTTGLALPDQQGFDTWFGFLNQFLLRGPNKEGEISYRRPTYQNPWLQGHDLEPARHHGHLTDILADEVVSRIQALSRVEGGEKQPWFINYWTFSPHNPATAAGEYLDRFDDTPDGRYLALLSQTDDAVGKVLAALDETGQGSNTMVVLASDNGGTNEMTDNNYPFQGKKGVYSEGGNRTPLVFFWPGQIEAGSTGKLAAIQDLMPTLLKVAGVKVDQDIDGENLFPRGVQKGVGKSSGRKKPVIWEIAGLYNHYYSFLDEKGRWRVDDGKLFDLRTDPDGRTNVSDSYPEVLERLNERYRHWALQAHKLDMQMKSTDRGGIRMTGEDLRRTPGYGGFTLAAELHHSRNHKPSGLVVHQDGVWSMGWESGDLVLQLNNKSWRVPDLQLNKACTPLVLTTYYYRSKLVRNTDHAVWVLYLDGKEVAMQRWQSPEIFSQKFSEVTVVGHDLDGNRQFSGRVKNPQIYNDFFYENDTWNVARGVKQLEKKLCQNPAWPVPQ
jgi:arylsulfatase A-like enzyme